MPENVFYPQRAESRLVGALADSGDRGMTELEIALLLPLPQWPRALFNSRFTYESAQLTIDGALVLQATTKAELERGVSSRLPDGQEIEMRLGTSAAGSPSLQVRVDGRDALYEDKLRARPTASAWIHASIALAASGAGFVASYLYVLRAATDETGWALKMANHMAGWHLLLVFVLFPTSIWGGRVGIRSVQFVSLMFFAIHVGIAVVNLGNTDTTGHSGPWIAVFNALSGVGFALAALYGNRAHHDMDPVAALRAGGI